ncbi:unnamed protein product, partial [marine sediment metagenome]
GSIWTDSRTATVPFVGPGEEALSSSDASERVAGLNATVPSETVSLSLQATVGVWWALQDSNL